MSPNHGGGGPDAVASSYLRARFRIDPHPDAGCKVLEAADRGEDVTQDIVGREGCDGCRCRVEVAVSDGGVRRLIDDTVEDHCVCPVFHRHDCLASIEAIEDGELVVTVATPDRAVLSETVASLREVGATVRLERIVRSTDDAGNLTLELDPDSITEKQREAVGVAVEVGYYDRPRKADLEDLAERLGISKSAVSQRLSSVEAKLVAELAEAAGPRSKHEAAGD